MARPSRHLAFACGALAGVIAAGVPAGAEQIYRYLDSQGRIVYSDRTPPADAKNVEAKRLTPNLIETDQTTLTAQRAQDRYPVTLYTFACGDVCDRAETLLNRRGVPYTTVNVQDGAGAEKLKKLTNDMQAPVLQAGAKLVVKGFGEAQWQALLDDAGYPKSPPLRRTQASAEALKSLPASPVSPAAAAAPVSERVSGGYPKD